MIIALETQLGTFAEKIRNELSGNNDELIKNTECSIFLRDPKKDSYILRASTTGSNYLGKAQLNTSDENRKKFDDNDMKNVGVTVSALFKEEPIICDDLIKDRRFSCFKLDKEKISDWECSNFCEFKSSDIFSLLVLPFRTSIEEESIRAGVVRLVRKKGVDQKFAKEDIDKLKVLVKSEAPWIKSSVFLSQLIEIGSYSDIPHLCKQAAFSLKDLLKGKGCSIFLLDEKDSKNGVLIYKPYGTTELVKKIIYDTEPKQTRYIQISEPLNDPHAWYYYDKDKYTLPNKGKDILQLPLTLGVIRARMPAFINDLKSDLEIINQFPKKYKIKRKPGHGKVCEFYLDEKEGKYQSTESILYAPMFYGDQNNTFSDVMGVVRIVRPPLGIGPFNVQDRHLFVSIVERLSEAISSAHFLQDLNKLSEIGEFKTLFEETVSIINKYIGGNDCALLIEKDQKLYKFAEWKEGNSVFIENDLHPYDLTIRKQWGYSGYVFKKGVPVMFNDPSQLKYDFPSDPPRHRKISGKLPRRFLGIPISKKEFGNKVLGVLRICKRDMSRKLTDNDRRMLELIGKSIRPRVEEFNEWLLALNEREKIFSRVLQKRIDELEKTTSQSYLNQFFKHVKPGHNVEFEILELFKVLWKYYEPEYDFNTKLFKDFELFNTNILTEIPHYRDHFIHQFVIFLIGIIIIDKLDDLFIETFKNAYPNTSIVNRTSVNDAEKKYQRKFIEFSWLKTALFHDIAYPIESVETWVTNILKKYLKGYRLDFKTRLPLGEIFFDPGYIDIIDTLVSYHKDVLKRRDEGLREKIVDLLYNKDNKPDHGIVSALLLIGENQFDMDDILPCASAIALHNNLIKKKNVENITFEKHPLAFLLIYCDLLHEWGREIFIKERRYPDLLDLFIRRSDDTSKIDKNNDTIRNRLMAEKNNKTIIYSKIKLFEDSENKEIEVHNCFHNLKSENLDFYIIVNNKVFPQVSN